jgi:hypothetical protein
VRWPGGWCPCGPMNWIKVKWKFQEVRGVIINTWWSVAYIGPTSNHGFFIVGMCGVAWWFSVLVASGLVSRWTKSESFWRAGKRLTVVA